MRNITRTVYGARLQSLQYFGLPYAHVANTTLNEKLNIFPDQHPSNTEMPSNRYFCIGNRGHRNAVSAEGFEYQEALQHQPSDGSLFGLMPFILRRVSDDLDIPTRAHYGLRRIEEHGGLNYVAYYGRRMDLIGVSSQMLFNHVENGEKTSSPFVPNSGNLNPTPPVIPPTGSVSTSGDFLSVSTKVSLSFDENDISEYIEASKIIYGDEKFAIISEIGIVAGCDKILTDSGLSYNEIVDAQITAFIDGYHPLNYTMSGLTIEADVGATQPLLEVISGP